MQKNASKKATADKEIQNQNTAMFCQSTNSRMTFPCEIVLDLQYISFLQYTPFFFPATRRFETTRSRRHETFCQICFPLTRLCKTARTRVAHTHHSCHRGSFNYSIRALARARDPAKAILVLWIGGRVCCRGPCGSVMANARRPRGQGLGHVRDSGPFPNDRLIVLTALPDSFSSATLGNMSTAF